MRERFKYLKLLSEYRSLNFELLFIKEILREGHLEFENYYRQYCLENNIDLEALNRQNQKRVDKAFSNSASTEIEKRIIQEAKKQERDVKQILKKVMKELHPDTLALDDPKRPYYEEGFKKANLASSQGKWGDFFDVVDTYEIVLGDYNEAIECLKDDIKRVGEEIKNEKSTYSWLLHECETEDQKIDVVKRFLKHLFNWKG